MRLHDTEIGGWKNRNHSMESVETSLDICNSDIELELNKEMMKKQRLQKVSSCDADSAGN